MFKAQGMLFLYTETPLHAGSGTSVAGVDLPIQRERHTQYPMIQSSGVKGAMRDLAEHLKKIPDKKARLRQLEEKEKKEALTSEEQTEKQTLQQELEVLTRQIEIVFGPETDRASEHGGALSFTDARILLFPVRSLVGVFAWITCPTVIERFKKDISRMELLHGIQIPDKEKLNTDWRLDARDQALIPESCKVKTDDGLIVLEDFAFRANSEKQTPVKALGEWLARYALPQDDAFRFWQKRLPEALVVVQDDVFRDFVQFSTEVISRIRIGETGTVEAGALWSEEHLPSDTLLYTLALATDPKDRNLARPYFGSAADILHFLKRDVLDLASVVQFGGDETVGRGIIQVTLLLPGSVTEGSDA